MRLYVKESPELIINEQAPESYFPQEYMRKRALSPLEALPGVEAGKISVKVVGGGKAGQADAVRLGIARVLAGLEESFRKNLKSAGLLTRDPRVKERKKPGLRRARRAPQWQKR